MSSATEFTGSVPANYDEHLGPLFFEPYALDLVNRIPDQQERVLELACGTGRVTKHLVAKVKADGALYATDLNPAMLDVAQRKVVDPRMQWQVVDAQDLPFEADFFDLVVCQFGVMFFQDKEKAFNEVHRVLKPGGLFLFNTWDEVQYNMISQITQRVLDEMLGADSPDFLEKGPYSFSDQGEIKRLMELAGFKDITIDLVVKVSTDSIPEHMAKGLVDGSPLSGYLDEKKAPKDAIKQRLLQEFSAQPGHMNYSMQALVCQGAK